MEVVVFLAMMIVPFISIAALVLTLINIKRVDSLKRLTLKFIGRKPESEKRAFLDEYAIDEV